MNRLKIIRGDSLDITVTVATSLNAPFDLTGFAATMTVKADEADSDSEAIIQAWGSVDVDTSTVSFSITADETEVAIGEYIYDIEIRNDSTGKVHTVVKDVMIVTYDVTRND